MSPRARRGDRTRAPGRRTRRGPPSGGATRCSAGRRPPRRRRVCRHRRACGRSRSRPGASERWCPGPRRSGGRASAGSWPATSAARRSSFSRASPSMPCTTSLFAASRSSRYGREVRREVVVRGDVAADRLDDRRRVLDPQLVHQLVRPHGLVAERLLVRSRCARRGTAARARCHSARRPRRRPSSPRRPRPARRRS